MTRQMKRQLKRRLVRQMMAFAACAGFAGLASAATIEWDGSVLEGYYNDPQSWVGGVVPNDPDNAMFRNGITKAGDYLVKIPAGGLTEGSATHLQYPPYGTTITFDATGTTWTKRREHGTSWQDSVIFRGENHFFNIEGLDAAKEHDHMGFTFTDGKIRYERAILGVRGSKLIFENGSFDMSLKDPERDQSKNQDHAAVLGYSTDVNLANSLVILAGGSHTFHNLNLRGNTPGFEMQVTGGEHHLTGSTYLSVSKSNEEPAVLHVMGGQLSCEGIMWIGKDVKASGILRVDGTGTFVANGPHAYFPDVTGGYGAIEVGGNGHYVSDKMNLLMSHNGGHAIVTVKDHGVMDMTSQFNMGEGNKQGSTTLTVKDDGVANLPNMTTGNNEGNTLTINLEDRGTLNGRLAMDLKKDTTLTFNMSGDAHFATVDSGRNQYFGNNNLGVAVLNLMGGTMDAGENGELNEMLLRGGPGSLTIFGGTHFIGANLGIEGPNDKNDPNVQSFTNTVKQTAGVVDVCMNGAGKGLDIRGGDGCHAMYLLEGGTLNVGKQGQGMLRLGHNRNSNGSREWHSIFRQTGGQANIGAAINFCDSATSGELELLGGRMKAWTLRGWNQCATRGGTSWASVYGNGGTIEPWQDNITFFYTMDEVTVGPQGLTVDTLTYNNVAMKVKIENAPDQDGLFVKTGTGKLKVGLTENDSGAKGDYAGRSLAGTQTYTRIDQGTLVFENAADNAVEFGKNVTVKGGATLSLEGAPEKMTVETLTLGDGRNFAVLKLDANDKVYVTGNNGITATCGGLDVPWAATNGTYPVFVCSGTVNPSELAKITVYNANSGKDYAWKTETVEGVTTCSMIVADRGEASSSITYGETKTTEGTGPVSHITVSTTSIENGDLNLARVAVVDVTDDQTMTLSGALTGTGSEIQKWGAGKLTLTGANPDFYGSFHTIAGILEVADRAAMGPETLYFPLTLGGSTFLYSDRENEAVVAGGLVIDADAKQKQTILKTEGDMTFNNVTYRQGAFTKLGAGTMTLDLPAGIFDLGTNADNEKVDLSDGPTVFPANGNAPESNKGLGGVNFLEGTVKMRGAGWDKTTVQTRNTAIMGGSIADPAPFVLDLEDVQFRFGDSGHAGQVCRGMPAGSTAPAIRLKNARLWSDSLTLGYSSQDPNAVIDIQMENSEFWPHYSTQIGGGTVGIKIDANNAQLQSDGMIGWRIQAKTIDADFYGEKSVWGSLCNNNTGNQSGQLVFWGSVTGQVKFRDGARMVTTRGLDMGNSPVDLIFDGGTFEIRNNTLQKERESIWYGRGDKLTGFKTTGEGLTIQIDEEDMTHEFKFPIFGDGSVTKTGKGTFKLVESRSEADKLLQSTGTLTVAEGTMVLDGALVKEEIDVVIAEGAVLDLNGSTLKAKSITGKGTVVNGTVQLTQVPYNAEGWATMGTGASIATGTILVDFKDATFTKAQYAAGIVITTYTGAKPTGIVLKAINVDSTVVPNARSQTVIADGKIMLKVAPSGFAISIK